MARTDCHTEVRAESVAGVPSALQSVGVVSDRVNAIACATVQPPRGDATYPGAHAPRHAAGSNAAVHRLFKQAMSHVRPLIMTGVCVSEAEGAGVSVAVREAETDSVGVYEADVEALAVMPAVIVAEAVEDRVNVTDAEEEGVNEGVAVHVADREVVAVEEGVTEPHRYVPCIATHCA